jgi:hypothetical protein
MRNKAIFIFIISSILFSCASDADQVVMTASEKLLFEQAALNGASANEGFIRCRNFVNGWLEYADPATGLIPRNIEASKDFWNAKDAAADNYPFMVLTSFFVDRELFEGTMLDMLETEKRLTSRVGSLPDTYSFSKQDFLDDEVKMPGIVFGTSEYIKDGLLPLTEWLGESPWSERMIEMLEDLNQQIDVAGTVTEKGFGKTPQDEVNGELLQVLSRIYWMTGNEDLLEWAIQIGDFYLLGDHQPTKDLKYLRLRDHGCELVSGLCELYLTTKFARPGKKAEYQQPLHIMLDRILEVGRNDDGFFYDAINPQTGEVLEKRIADTWGYTLNGYYGIFMIDGKQEYLAAIQKVFSNLYKYKDFDWEGGSSDGYADAIESALNLYNRIPDPEVAKWIDSETRVMWAKQQESGIIEGWHGDGNFARTTIMYNLWKSKGVSIQPWREDVLVGAVQSGDSLIISLKSAQPWEGKLYFDRSRSKANMKLPLDWPRINQFPEWFVADPEKSYKKVDYTAEEVRDLAGSDLMNGLDVRIDGEHMLLIH